MWVRIPLPQMRNRVMATQRPVPNSLSAVSLKSRMPEGLHWSPVRSRPLRKQGSSVVEQLSDPSLSCRGFQPSSLDACGTTGERDNHSASGFNSHTGRETGNVSQSLASATFPRMPGKTTLGTIGRRFESDPAQAGSSARIERWKCLSNPCRGFSFNQQNIQPTGECR